MKKLKFAIIGCGRISYKHVEALSNNINEADINFKISQKLGFLLQQCGCNVIYTRENRNSIAINEGDTIREIKKKDMLKRKTLRDSSKADIFISIHMNFFENSKYSGAQVFYDNDSRDSGVLAEFIQQSMKELNPSNTRSVKGVDDSIFLLNNTNVTSVLVECGFLSNPEEETLLASDLYQNKVAYAIFKGILQYMNK